MNIELYIGDRLCDIGNPENLGIYLKRVFIKPSELSVKDAQKSYEISLPATATNNEIFNYTNVEEVQGKFKVYDKARLYIDGILILDGKFRMSQITRDAYIGNLGVPAAKTVKDIFGETMMNQAGKWLIDFNNLSSISHYNTKENAECIFPLVLYKLLPKLAVNNNYSDKDVYDSSVMLDLKDFPPSVNAVQMLKRIFSNMGYTLSGTALNDERIKNLYVSYRNSNDYNPAWNVNPLKIRCSWKNLNDNNKIEEYHAANKIGSFWVVPVNMFNASNKKISKLIDSPMLSEVGNKTVIRIPESGLYKIEMDVEINNDFPPYYYGQYGFLRQDFNSIKTEVSLLRNFGGDLTTIKYDNVFYSPNISQTEDVEGSFFPTGVNFIDPMQNPNMVCGISCGRFAYPAGEFAPYNNPAWRETSCNPMAVSGGESWNEEIKDRAYSAVTSLGYMKRTNGILNLSSKFNVDLRNSNTYASLNSDYKATGKINQVIWLNEGDTFDLITICNSRTWSSGSSNRDWNRQEITVNLAITPFKYNRNWIKVDDSGKTPIDVFMDWTDKANFLTDKLDLIRFLPSEIKVNDWIDNFCKTFNLNLVNSDKTHFSLDIKNNEHKQSTSIIIDLDKKGYKNKSNADLNLPYLYEFNFTNDTAEEGYYRSMKDVYDEEGGITGKDMNTALTGTGRFETGSSNTNTIQQSSGFSYCWYKDLYSDPEKQNTLIKVPVITENEIWETDSDYEEMLKKDFYNKNQRFWYKADVKELELSPGVTEKIAVVSNEYKGKQHSILDYENKEGSLMRNFFFLFSSDKHYTSLECILTPEEYNNLNRAVIKFNGDLYSATDIDGYDPLMNKLCKLNLIRLYK